LCVIEWRHFRSEAGIRLKGKKRMILGDLDLVTKKEINNIPNMNKIVYRMMYAYITATRKILA
jgi:hypothetical protein